MRLNYFKITLHIRRYFSGAYCRDKTYRTKHLDLPQRYQLNPSKGVTCTVDYATTDLIPELRRVIEKAEHRGDNVGKGEYSDDYLYKNVINKSELFVATNPSSTNDICAFFAIQPCPYAQGYDTCLATAKVFRSDDLADDDVSFRSLVNLASQFTAKLDAGYTHVVMDVAFCCTSVLRALKDEGFLTTAILPANVNISGFGVVENVLHVKSLGLPPRPSRNPEEVLEMLHRSDPSDDFQQHYSAMTLPLIPFLPKSYNFNCGIKAVIRNMTKEEDFTVFSMLTENARQGKGYAVYEFPSFNYFLKYWRAESYGIAFEEEESGKIIGYNLMQETSFDRGLHDQSQSDLVICREYQNRGIGVDTLKINRAIARELGYNGCMNNFYVNNARVPSMIKQTGGVFVGILPNAGYVNGYGWEDAILNYTGLEQMKKFAL